MKKYFPILILVLIAGGVYFALKPKTVKNESPQPAQIESSNISVPENTIVYTDSGFSPKTITVTKGTTVTFVNESNTPMWVASSVHPTHQDYPEFDQLKGVRKGEKYSFTFDKKGEWKFHNHLKAFDIGTVIVN